MYTYLMVYFVIYQCSFKGSQKAWMSLYEVLNNLLLDAQIHSSKVECFVMFLVIFQTSYVKIYAWNCQKFAASVVCWSTRRRKIQLAVTKTSAVHSTCIVT